MNCKEAETPGAEIVYCPAHYENPAIREQLLKLYRDIFRVEFSEGYRKYFLDWPDFAGVVALESRTGEIAGHFAAARFHAVIAGELMPFRMSMGFMTSPNFRGRGIATQLYRNLRDEILRRNDAKFIIGFPNDVSYHMHTHGMDYVSLKDYRFTVLPKSVPAGHYLPLSDFRGFRAEETPDKRNHLLYSAEYLSWRYRENQYEKWVSGEGRLFVSTRFRDKADILYWDLSASEEELLDFAAFLYERYAVSRVTTWNSAAFLNQYPAEERRYHMCVNCLNADSAEKESILGEWLFRMGDCELF